MKGSSIPDLTEEYALRAAGHEIVAGLDEAGRGAWAGPVCAGAVVLPLECEELPVLLKGVRDSKLLSVGQREALLPVIHNVALAVGVGWGEPAEVDLWGVVPATRMAMRRALGRLGHQLGAVVVDYLALPGLDVPQRSLPKADARCLSVAAASIVAKVTRDRLMVGLDEEYPGYGFAQHKGYGTRQHREALARLGPTCLHRVSWRPMCGNTRQRAETDTDPA